MLQPLIFLQFYTSMYMCSISIIKVVNFAK
jgi:hypothetical protein